MLEYVLDAAILHQFFLEGSFGEGGDVLLVIAHLAEVFRIRIELCAKVLIVEECVPFVTYVDETCV